MSFAHGLQNVPCPPNTSTESDMVPNIQIQIQPEDPATPDVSALLSEHLSDMAATSPPESVHALDITALRADNIDFYTARALNNHLPEGARQLLGCAALKQLSADEGELKSMRTAQAHLRKGVAGQLLQHIVEQARLKGMSSLSLETGTPDYFRPARQLYARFGFIECPPFADYKPDPFSLCMRYML